MAIRWKNPPPTRGKCNILGDDEYVFIALPSSLVSSDTHSIQGTMNGALPFLIIVTLLFHLAFSASIEEGGVIKNARRSRSVVVTEEEPEITRKSRGWAPGECCSRHSQCESENCGPDVYQDCNHAPLFPYTGMCV